MLLPLPLLVVILCITVAFRVAVLFLLKIAISSSLQHSRKRDQRAGVLTGVWVVSRAGMLLMSHTSLAPQLDLPRGAAAERRALDGRDARRDPGDVHYAKGHVRGREPRRPPRGDGDAGRLLLVDGRRILRDGVGAVACVPGPSRSGEPVTRCAAAATASSSSTSRTRPRPCPGPPLLSPYMLTPSPSSSSNPLAARITIGSA